MATYESCLPRILRLEYRWAKPESIFSGQMTGYAAGHTFSSVGLNINGPVLEVDETRTLPAGSMRGFKRRSIARHTPDMRTGMILLLADRYLCSMILCTKNCYSQSMQASTFWDIRI